MAEYLGINRSSTHRLLVTLERHGYVAQDPNTDKYQLGMRVFEAGAVVLNQMSFRAAARPHIEYLARETGEVVHLAVENGNQCVYIDKVEGIQHIPMGSQLGWRRPLYCTGIGKALLANLPDQRIEQYLKDTKLLPLTPQTITDTNALRAELIRIRATGIAYDREEIEQSLSCVAAVVRGTNGQLVGAISVAGPTTRMNEEEVKRIKQLVLGAAELVSSGLVTACTQPKHL